MKLYELTEQYKSLEFLEATDDLPAEVIMDTLEGLKGTLTEKATNVGLFIRNMESTAEAIQEAAKTMLARADRASKRAQSLKDYLLLNMQACGITKIESPFFSLLVQNNPPAVVVDNVADIPDEFMTQPPPPPTPPKTPDKKLISAAIKSGKEVPGCHSEQKQRLVFKL